MGRVISSAKADDIAWQHLLARLEDDYSFTTARPAVPASAAASRVCSAPALKRHCHDDGLRVSCVTHRYLWCCCAVHSLPEHITTRYLVAILTADLEAACHDRRDIRLGFSAVKDPGDTSGTFLCKVSLRLVEIALHLALLVPV
eukprot:SAG22_NODE_9685_length_575_cov_0.867647_1_plen_143_part_10